MIIMVIIYFECFSIFGSVPILVPKKITIPVRKTKILNFHTGTVGGLIVCIPRKKCLEIRKLLPN